MREKIPGSPRFSVPQAGHTYPGHFLCMKELRDGNLPCIGLPFLVLHRILNDLMQRRRRHFKSGQATANKRSLVHVEREGGGGSTTGNVRQ